MVRAFADPLKVRLPWPAQRVMFRDRVDAGERLAHRLSRYRGTDALVVGIPRGGVPVAAAVARALDADLDIVVARKLGAPFSEELAIGAVTADGVRFLNDAMIAGLGVDSAYLEQETRRESTEAARREARFRGGAPPLDVAGRTVILVDDGLATGATMIAAARSIRARQPARLVIAVPVGSPQACHRLQSEADEVVCLEAPESFWAVGLYYQDFSQTEDSEVERLLCEARGKRESLSPAAAP